MNSNDWTCIKCKFVVFGSKGATKCPKCRTPKAKRGDWMCPSCNTLIFASKDQCSKCNTTKESSMTTRPGDWHCSNCNTLVFASRTECFKCQTPKPGVTIDSNGATSNGVSPDPLGECKICMSNTINAVYPACGHMCACFDCSQATTRCPICRANGKGVKIFIS